MKHLNPRQGITTMAEMRFLWTEKRRECETPKSPPGDYHSSPFGHCQSAGLGYSVKHLNPRQGITTYRRNKRFAVFSIGECETPKSPPGDYHNER